MDAASVAGSVAGSAYGAPAPGVRIECSRWTLRFDASAGPGPGPAAPAPASSVSLLRAASAPWSSSRLQVRIETVEPDADRSEAGGGQAARPRTGSLDPSALTARRFRLRVPDRESNAVGLERHYALANAARRMVSTRVAVALAAFASVIAATHKDSPAYSISQFVVGVPLLLVVFGLSFFPAPFIRFFEPVVSVALVVYGVSQISMYETLVGSSPHLLLTCMLVFWGSCSLIGLRFHVSVAVTILLVAQYLLAAGVSYAQRSASETSWSYLSVLSCLGSALLAVGASYLRDRNERRLFLQELRVVANDGRLAERMAAAAGAGAGAPRSRLGSASENGDTPRAGVGAGPATPGTPPGPPVPPAGSSPSQRASRSGRRALSDGPAPRSSHSLVPLTALEATQNAAAALAAAASSHAGESDLEEGFLLPYPSRAAGPYPSLPASPEFIHSPPSVPLNRAAGARSPAPQRPRSLAWGDNANKSPAPPSPARSSLEGPEEGGGGGPGPGPVVLSLPVSGPLYPPGDEEAEPEPTEPSAAAQQQPPAWRSSSTSSAAADPSISLSPPTPAPAPRPGALAFQMPSALLSRSMKRTRSHQVPAPRPAPPRLHWIPGPLPPPPSTSLSGSDGSQGAASASDVKLAPAAPAPAPAQPGGGLSSMAEHILTHRFLEVPGHAHPPASSLGPGPGPGPAAPPPPPSNAKLLLLHPRPLNSPDIPDPEPHQREQQEQDAASGGGEGDGFGAAAASFSSSPLRRAARWLLHAGTLDPPCLEAQYQRFYAAHAWGRVRFLSAPLLAAYFASILIFGLLASSSGQPFSIHAGESMREHLWRTRVDWILELGVVGGTFVVGVGLLYARPARVVPFFPYLVVFAFLLAQFAGLTSLKRIMDDPELKNPGRSVGRALRGPPATWYPEFWYKISSADQFFFLSSTFWLPLRLYLAASSAVLVYAAYVLLAAAPADFFIYYVNFLIVPSAIGAIACARAEVNLRRRFCIERGLVTSR
eukprot:tig00020908_g15308.t1